MTWLAFGDSLLGAGVRDGSVSYPPLVPVLTKLSVAVFGLTAGVSLVASVSAVAPAVGVFVTLGACGFGRSCIVQVTGSYCDICEIIVRRSIVLEQPIRITGNEKV